MTIVSGLDDCNDWRFGKSLAQYKVDSNAVFQNVETRIRSFINDWFLDTATGIDWYTLLGNKGTETQILREIERVVLQTPNVRAIESLSVVSQDENRDAVISLEYTTLFDDTIQDEIRIES